MSERSEVYQEDGASRTHPIYCPCISHFLTTTKYGSKVGFTHDADLLTFGN
jgi:hypothetical protein